MRTFTVTGMSCQACSSRVEKTVSSLPGVKYCSVSLLSGRMTLEGDASDEEIISAVVDAGYGAEKSDDREILTKKEKRNNREIKVILLKLGFSLFLLLLLMYLGMGEGMFGLPLPCFFAELPLLNPILQAILSLAIIIINGKFYISGVKAVFRGAPNMDTLVFLGSAASYIFSAVTFVLQASSGSVEPGNLYFESAAMILVFVSLGKMLETKAKKKAADSLKQLAELMPDTATLIVDGKEKKVKAESILPGDVFAVRPGEKFPADGTVLEGFSASDESAFTGESIPCEKEKGSKVFTATVNLSGYLKCRADKHASESSLAAVIRAAEDAAATKAPVSRLADRIAAILVPAVLCTALITFVIWLICGYGFAFALTRAVSVLVITCPCSLGLATPVAVTLAGGIGAKKGILFKNAPAIEELSGVSIAVFDKTGTLTTGKPRFTDIITPPEITEEYALSLAAALEFKSEHPLSKGITEEASARNIQLPETQNFTVYPGSGLSAEISRHSVFGGSKKFMTEKFILPEDVSALSDSLSRAGKTPLIFTCDGRFLCVIGEKDSLKQDAKQAVESLRRRKISCVMLTGDNKTTTASVAEELGISKYEGEILPDEKATAINKLKQYGKVAMVGDGINDAPALIASNVGIALGTGTDIAVDSADIVIPGTGVSDVNMAVDISRRTMKIIRENLFWAFFYNIICIPLAAGAFIPLFGIALSPMICSACMSLSSLCVVSNSLRLNYIFRNKKETTDMKITMKIQGMMCPHCEARVKSALTALPFVENAEVSHKKNCAVVNVTGAGHEEELTSAVESQGYKILDIK